jgi:hypothetical protein
VICPQAKLAQNGAELSQRDGARELRQDCEEGQAMIHRSSARGSTHVSDVNKEADYADGDLRGTLKAQISA